MIGWGEAVDAIASANPAPELGPKRLPRLLAKTPVIIGGAAGSGKTRLWESLTGRRPAPPRASDRSDDGFLARKSRATIALRTVPGQECREHYETLKESFDTQSTLKGVIFVATYGFDHIWPSASCDVIARSLRPFELKRLRERNRREELASFDHICRLVGQKYALRSPTVKWLQVVVNKADLYWDERDQVAEYYSLGGDSDFSRVARDLIGRVGSQNLEWSVLPSAQQPAGYSFDSAHGRLTATSRLDEWQCAASVSLLKNQLEELSERVH